MGSSKAWPGVVRCYSFENSSTTVAPSSLTMSSWPERADSSRSGSSSSGVSSSGETGVGSGADRWGAGRDEDAWACAEVFGAGAADEGWGMPGAEGS